MRSSLFPILMSPLGGLDPSVRALIDRLGFIPPAYQLTAYNTLVVGMKNAGIWDKLDAFGCLAPPGNAASTAPNLLNWKGTSPFSALTITGAAGTYYPNVGYAGTGTSTTGTYLGTGTNANAFSQLTNNSITTLVYVDTFQSGNGNPVQGVLDGANDRLRLTFNNGGNAATRLNDATTLSGANSASNGLIVGVRSGATSKELFVNGVSIATSSTSATTLGATEVVFLGNGTSRSNATISFWGLGGALTSAQVSTLYTLCEAFLDAIAPIRVLFRFSGQSLAQRLFIDSATVGSGDGTTGSNSAQRVFLPLVQSYLAAVPSNRPYYVRLLNTAVSGSRVVPQVATNTWWGVNGVASGPGVLLTNEDTTTAAVSNISKCQIVDIWVQGEAEASTNNSSILSDWTTQTGLVLQHKADQYPGKIKFVLAPLSGNSDADIGVPLYRSAQNTIVGARTDTVMSAEKFDLVRWAANDWHPVSYGTSVNGFDLHAKRLA